MHLCSRYLANKLKIALPEVGYTRVKEPELDTPPACSTDTRQTQSGQYILGQTQASSSSSSPLTMETPGLPRSDHSIWNVWRTSSSHRGNWQRSLSLVISYIKEKQYIHDYQQFYHYNKEKKRVLMAITYKQSHTSGETDSHSKSAINRSKFEENSIHVLIFRNILTLINIRITPKTTTY